MARSKKNKKVLLIEPNYANKFPPVGLMKIATYYRNRGELYGDVWEVVFYKGDLKKFVIERITDNLIERLNDADGTNRNWYFYKDILFEYVRTRRTDLLDSLPLMIPATSDDEKPVKNIVLFDLVNEAKDKYWKKTWEQEPEWDRVGVTTLFTFYWDITIETIEFAKKWHGANRGRIMVDMSLHAEYTNVEKCARYVGEYAKENGLRMQFHLSETEKEHRECIGRHGLTPTEFFLKAGVLDVPSTAAHCVYLTENDMDILAEKGTYVAHNPVSNLKLGSGIMPYSLVKKHNVNLALGTDGVASNNRLDKFTTSPC